MMRAVPVQAVMQMAMMRLPRPAFRNATRMMVSGSEGMAMATLMICEITRSTQPPKYPDSTPSAVPMTVTASAETTPMSSEMRVP